ncbi:hypothetical protein NECAME_16873 [Necator americanus]|uniref:DUF4139 domain-containing protein n=1 Tax=Necator americanus TaxID=51031 RepID=W2TVU7_NECAM|nr:hypothetical protein NECAME_16873 [Necator americanus]ETN85186.1 hypothetical protein NECAME_16873 [Necator americanus]
MKNVTNRIVPDSVRVDGRGDGIIHDVQLRDKPTIHEETDSPIAIELRERIEEKLKEVNLLKDRETVLKRRIEILDKIVGEVATAAPMKPHALSTEFTISKPAAIPSDGAAHKVTVGILDVDPVLLRQCVPSKNLSAFLTAFAVNTSQLPLLLGDAAVYLNNSFVSKVGIIAKISSTVHDQLIVVKNTRNESLLLTIKESIPQSTDEQIRIRLISPEIPSSDVAKESEH